MFTIVLFKHNQQDAMLHNGFYYYKCRAFQAVSPPIIRSSKLCTQHRVFVELFLLLTAIVSELELQLTQNCVHSIGCLSSFSCFLQLSWVSWNSNSLTIAVRSRKSLTNTRCCVHSFELLMMGGGTAWNMCSTYSNKYHCVTLHLVGYALIH
jgi:hypothetical protein